MEDQTYSCPFCCNEQFSSKEFLVEHLSKISEILVCPICKSNISSLDSLISHLKYDNCTETIVICKYSENEKNVMEKTNQNEVQYEFTDNTQENDDNIDSSAEDISEVSKIYTEFLSKQLINSHEIKVVKDNGNRYLLVSSNEAMSENSNLVSKQNNDGTISFTIQNSNEDTENPDLVENNEEEELEEENQTNFSKVEIQEEMYTCNTCGVSFTSVMDHIQNYHNDQDVVVEEPLDDGSNNTISMEYQQATEEDPNADKQAPRRMITETGNIVEEPLAEPEEKEQVRVIIPVKKESAPKGKNSRKRNEVDALNNGVVKEIKVAGNSNSPNHKVLVKTIEAPNGNKVKVYNCMACNYLLSSLAEFINHPCKKQRYSCPHCVVVYDNPKSLCAHMKVHKEKPVRFACPVCSEAFDEPNALCLHINEHKCKPDANTIIVPAKFDCEICSTKFPTSKSLKLHKRMHYPVKSRPIEPPVDGAEGVDKYLCGVCMKLIPMDYRTIHMNSHKAGNKMICDICNKKFATKEYLEMHMTVHNMDKVTVGKQDQSLPYQCLYCNRKFARPHEKVKHERIHTGEKPHSCEICGKSFRVSYCLTLHMRTHTGARPYECPHCPKRFKAHSVYNHHLLTHSEVRAYKCPFCPKAFKTSVQLAGHRNSHTKPFSCQHCNRPFASLYAVRVHMEVHSRQNNLKFSCAQCGASYARAFALKDHVRTAHPQLKESEWLTPDSTETEEKRKKEEETETIDKNLPSDMNEIEMNSSELIVS